MNYKEIKEVFKKLANMIADDKAIIKEKENYIMGNRGITNYYDYKSYSKEVSFSIYENVTNNKIEVTFNVADIQDYSEDHTFVDPSRKLIKAIVNTIKYNSIL